MSSAPLVLVTALALLHSGLGAVPGSVVRDCFDKVSSLEFDLRRLKGDRAYLVDHCCRIAELVVCVTEAEGLEFIERSFNTASLTKFFEMCSDNNVDCSEGRERRDRSDESSENEINDALEFFSERKKKLDLNDEAEDLEDFLSDDKTEYTLGDIKKRNTEDREAETVLAELADEMNEKKKRETESEELEAVLAEIADEIDEKKKRETKSEEVKAVLEELADEKDKKKKRETESEEVEVVLAELADEMEEKKKREAESEEVETVLAELADEMDEKKKREAESEEVETVLAELADEMDEKKKRDLEVELEESLENAGVDRRKR